MRTIIDSNVLFSALIKDSTTRRIILEHEGFFLCPEIILEETDRHKQYLLEKSKMKEAEFNQLLELILRKIILSHGRQALLKTCLFLPAHSPTLEAPYGLMTGSSKNNPR